MNCLVFAEHFLKLQRANLLSAARVTHREQFLDLEWRDQVVIAAGAAMAPNPQTPPWLCDLPLQEVDGQAVLRETVHSNLVLAEYLRPNAPRRLPPGTGRANPRHAPRCTA